MTSEATFFAKLTFSGILRHTFLKSWRIVDLLLLGEVRNLTQNDKKMKFDPKLKYFLIEMDLRSY